MTDQFCIIYAINSLFRMVAHQITHPGTMFAIIVFGSTRA